MDSFKRQMMKLSSQEIYVSQRDQSCAKWIERASGQHVTFHNAEDQKIYNNGYAFPDAEGYVLGQMDLLGNNEVTKYFYSVYNWAERAYDRHHYKLGFLILQRISKDIQHIIQWPDSKREAWLIQEVLAGKADFPLAKTTFGDSIGINHFYFSVVPLWEMKDCPPLDKVMVTRSDQSSVRDFIKSLHRTSRRMSDFLDKCRVQHSDPFMTEEQENRESIGLTDIYSAAGQLFKDKKLAYLYIKTLVDATNRVASLDSPDYRGIVFMESIFRSRRIQRLAELTPQYRKHPFMRIVMYFRIMMMVLDIASHHQRPVSRCYVDFMNGFRNQKPMKI